ncbi:MAG: HlyD family type I secretion periplasmic adaptor subunit [Betaproteobacteria bacterium]|nr:HlyD family type I secretion periplasmic adaptor subunit [Betaproteobacteria bacterium]
MTNTKDDLPYSGHILVFASAAAIGGFVYWANWAEIDQITRAQGQVIASSRNQVIQELDGGIVEEILVREGSAVKEGQILVRFDKSKTETSYLESRAKGAALKAAVARLKAEAYGGQPQFPPELEQYPDIRASQEMLFKKRQAAINEELGALRQSLELVKSELAINLPLLQGGDVSKAEVLKLQRQVADIEGTIANRRNKYLQDSQADLSKALEDLAGLEQIVAQRKDQLERTVVTAPMDGIVRNVRISTRGGVARPGEEIMQIVPIEDDLLIEAKVKPSDIAFVKPGLPTTVKLDAYDYTVYGALQGTVSYISADTLSDETRTVNDSPYYRVQVKTKVGDIAQHGGKRIEIQPGMTASVEIKTGSNTVWKYLTKPITKTIAESLGER